MVDKNNAIWHKTAGLGANRYAKSSSRLTRLKRLQPLHHAYAAKLIKLGFRNRFWAEPDPRDVPGFEAPGPQRRRRDARWGPMRGAWGVGGVGAWGGGGGKHWCC